MLRATRQETSRLEQFCREPKRQRMTWSIAAATLALLVWCAPSQATISPGCPPNPLPATPASPAAALDTVNFGEGMHVDVWRQPCLDGSSSVVLMRVAPTTAVPFLCSGDLTLLQ